MNKTTHRCPGIALAIAAIVLAPGLAPRVAWADDPPVHEPGLYPPIVNGPEKISDVDDESPVPHGYTRVTRTRKGLILGGAITVSVSYVVTAWWGSVLNGVERDFGTPGKTTDFSWLYIPVAGPFLQLGHMNNSDSDLARRCFVIEGITQAVGAALLLYGLGSSQTILMRNDQLSIAPMAGAGTSGVTVAGRF